jgi:hypothetical protein
VSPVMTPELYTRRLTRASFMPFRLVRSINRHALPLA